MSRFSVALFATVALLCVFSLHAEEELEIEDVIPDIPTKDKESEEAVVDKQVEDERASIMKLIEEVMATDEGKFPMPSDGEDDDDDEQFSKEEDPVDETSDDEYFGQQSEESESSDDENETHIDSDIDADFEEVTSENGEPAKKIGADPDWDQDARANTIHPEDYPMQAELLESYFVAWDQEQHILGAAGLEQAKKVVDIGCGPGILAEKLLEWLPNIHVVCFDVDDTYLNMSKQRLEKFAEAQRVSFVQGSAEQTGLEKGEYDAVIFRFVLQYLADPFVAVKEARRLLKTDGLLVGIEMDEGCGKTIDPELMRLDDMHDRQERYIQTGSHVPDPAIGRRLPALYTALDFTGVSYHVVAAHSQVYGIKAMAKLHAPRQYAQLVRANRASPRQIEDAELALRQFTENPRSTIIQYYTVVTGKKEEVE